MTRGLTKDERALWERLRESVKPLKKRAPKAPALSAAPAAEDRATSTPPKSKRAPRAATAEPRPAKATPALAPLEEKTRRRLARGLVEIDARIDLHGMRQERAFSMLAAFLRREQARGARIVLVVTGKGRPGDEGRGVLRQSVPDWLARGDLRHLVVGFEEAGRRHGGAGALYVRIRRRRESARSHSPGA